MKRILVPLDGSSTAEQALKLALEEARLHEAELIVLHAMSFPRDLMWLDHLPRPGEWAELARTEAQDYMDRVRSRLSAQVPTRARLESGPPARTIDAVAREEEADLIILATHGRTGLLGGVASKLLQLAPCPVLLVPIKPDQPMDKVFRGLC
ncbi:MAG: hypothetical protein AMXMBFR33_73380 [Candidatus Xenobia bacterium]